MAAPSTDLDSTGVIPQPTMRAHAEPGECEILLIRHGRSADVRPGSPESADPPLHPMGVEQATRLAHRLADKPLAAVYSSHLARAYQTAEHLALPRGMQVGVFEDLEEIRLGDWSNGEFRRRASIGDPEWVAWSRTGRWDGIPGGEGDEALRQRFAAVVTGLATTHRGQSIAIVAHGGAISAYLAHLHEIHRSFWTTIENTSISVVRLNIEEPASAVIVVVNDCHHLYDPVLGAQPSA